MIEYTANLVQSGEDDHGNTPLFLVITREADDSYIMFRATELEADTILSEIIDRSGFRCLALYCHDLPNGLFKRLMGAFMESCHSEVKPFLMSYAKKGEK